MLVVAGSNQSHSCIHSEIAFIINGKEKRIRLREIEFRLRSISRTYWKLLQFIEEKVEKGEISPSESIL